LSRGYEIFHVFLRILSFYNFTEKKAKQLGLSREELIKCYIAGKALGTYTKH